MIHDDPNVIAADAAIQSAQFDAFNNYFATASFDLSGKIIRANEKFLNLLGFKLSDAVGKDGDFFAARGEADRASRDLVHVIETGKPQVATRRWVAADGKQIWLNSNYTPVKNPAGVTIEIFKISSDITAQQLQLAEDRGQVECIDASHAVAHFSLDGEILDANPGFLTLMGYKREEIIGKHHRIFVDQKDLEAGKYKEFWSSLAAGTHYTAEFKRIGKNGKEVWIQATYNPIPDLSGKPFKVVKYATDITAQKLRQAEYEWQIAAIRKSQCVITFDMNGVILDANERFLEETGYRLDELQGRHHRMFVDPSYAHGSEYIAFWRNLRKGRHSAGLYKRIAKDGAEVWLQATYSPVFDMNGRPVKVVKHATVVTDEKRQQAEYQGQIAAIHKSQCVASFDLNGNIIDANDNFLFATGYTYAEVLGKHHSMFVGSDFAKTEPYANFWNSLAHGNYQAGEYKRYGRDGREIWLRATYNPIFDMNGRPIKVVQYATVVTDEKLRQAEYEGQIAAINKAQNVISFDLDGNVIDANKNFLNAVGYSIDEIKGKHHSIFVDPAFARSSEYKAFWNKLANGEHQSGEYKRFGRDGAELWIQATYNPIFDMNGRPFKIVRYATVTTQEKLKQADFQSQITAINKAQGVVTLSLDGTILEANNNFLSALGYARDEVIGKPQSLFVEAGHAQTAEYQELWRKLRSGEFHAGMVKRVGKNGKRVWLQASYNPVFDLNGRPAKVIKFATDVTSNVALAEAFEDATRQAQHDAATALPNRVRLASFMTSALAKPDARMTILYLDLDRFKPINDTYGHHIGDRVLGEVADRLRRTLRREQLAARIGGDEFVIAAPDLEESEIEPFCRRLLSVVSAPITHDGRDISVGVSIGIAVSPADGTTPDDLLRSADAALYRSKEEGRNTYNFFDQKMNDRVASQRQLSDDIRRGLAAGEFYLEFQPRFNTLNRSIRSAEALVRWLHPERGRIPPNDFIPIAEQSGHMRQLGQWILRTACENARLWGMIGVSINVSPSQLRDGNFVDMVRKALDDNALPGAHLEIEITERALFEDTGYVRATIDGLKALGVKIAIDDFGTGYSSLGYLQSFPIDVLKIDRTFISDMQNDNTTAALVESIVGLGRALGMSVTAEGVETSDQLALLKLDQCPEVQGFLLGAPMSGAEFAKQFVLDSKSAPSEQSAIA